MLAAAADCVHSGARSVAATAHGYTADGDRVCRTQARPDPNVTPFRNPSPRETRHVQLLLLLPQQLLLIHQPVTLLVS